MGRAVTAARKPDIVCIGAQKAGTSWLHEVLGARPDVWVPPFKELHFFDHRFVPECRRWTPWHVRRGLKAARARHLEQVIPPCPAYLAYIDRLEQGPPLNAIWYEYVFSRAEAQQNCLDVTPEYCCIPAAGVAFFARFLPQTQIVYIIRDPLDRLKSQVRMIAQRRKDAKLTEADWAQILEMPALRSRGDYLNNVPRWDAHFGPERLLYLPFGLIRSDPGDALRQVEAHCALPAQTPVAAGQKVHATAPLDLPEAVLGALTALARPQQRFLEDRFGAGFLQQIA
ncbi:sulfotransferase family protein [Roseobacter sinensis]|uniref:Sulfotransferase n=1 Tax=Roseobacter sinensis TaxID=2931391 RepID=A0ABT3BHS6_9RHOB|nr:sulfotransferase [Roseobacter sp. WL0113]MCV3272669.1 sulfotransferase [Roseobacter sp. WL0113]